MLPTADLMANVLVEMYQLFLNPDTLKDMLLATAEFIMAVMTLLEYEH